jgi:hypothetical protein
LSNINSQEISRVEAPNPPTREKFVPDQKGYSNDECCSKYIAPFFIESYFAIKAERKRARKGKENDPTV